MINPFDSSGTKDHYPGHISKAFEDLGERSCHTESLLASKSRMLSFSNNSDKKALISLWHKSANSEEEKSLSVADLASTDTFAISKSSKETNESKYSKDSKESKDIKDLKDFEPLYQPKGFKRSEETLMEESKSLKPPRIMNLESSKSFAKISDCRKDKLHCKTCKCLENSNSTIRPLVESESLNVLSGLESLPKRPWEEQGWELGSKTVRATHKPYTSPLFNGSTPPSQIFRQRINSHILSSGLARQVSMPVFK